MFPSLSSKLLSYVLGGLLVLAGLTIGYQWLDNRGLRKDLAETEQALDVTKQANAILENSIGNQNRAIEALRVDGEARSLDLEAIARRARQDASAANERARRILQASGRTCEDADRLILENIR